MATTLGDICKVDWGNTAITKKSYVEDGKFLAVSATGGDGKLNHYEHEADVCVLSAIGAQCGKMFFPQQRFTAIKNTITLTPKADKVFSKFLYYLFTAIELPKRGTAQPFISKGDIQNFNVPFLPPLAEQQSIVAKLDAAFAEIDNLIKTVIDQKVAIQDTYNSKISSILSKLLTDRSTEKLQQLCDKITVGYVGKMSNQYVDNGVPFLRSQSIRPYEISEKGLLFISEKFNKQISKSQLRKNDVCVVRTGYPGTAAQVTEQWEGANCSDLVIFTPGKNLSSEFLVLFFNSQFGKKMVLGKVVGAAQKHFNVTTAKQVDFPCVEIDEQNFLVKRTNALRENIAIFESIFIKKQNALIQLKSAILSKELQCEVA
ncbi:restriction endonuclease subunit S [Prochlorococcus sp. MIT 1011]|uniref:restriction endonuclease subunit S n=1 Tax=Prochlorococcus sp. MIT 1011 TaxID=3082520 RepID=UPI0039B46ACF